MVSGAKPTTVHVESMIKDELITLLQACIGRLQEPDDDGSFSPIFYQTMAVLHAYTMEQVGIRPVPTSSRPSFQIGSMDDVLASGWIEEMSSASGGKRKHVVWKQVLALLVQKGSTDEPCLWITREIMAESEAGEPELENMHRIPMKRLLSVEYVDFYGDHRVALKLRKRDADLIFRCQDAVSAKCWTEQLELAKMNRRASSKSWIPTEEGVEVEIEKDLMSDAGSQYSVENSRTFDDQALADCVQEGDDLRRIRQGEGSAELKGIKDDDEEDGLPTGEEQQVESQQLKAEGDYEDQSMGVEREQIAPLQREAGPQLQTAEQEPVAHILIEEQDGEAAMHQVEQERKAAMHQAEQEREAAMKRDEQEGEAQAQLQTVEQEPVAQLQMEEQEEEDPMHQTEQRREAPLQGEEQVEITPLPQIGDASVQKDEKGEAPVKKEEKGKGEALGKKKEEEKGAAACLKEEQNRASLTTVQLKAAQQRAASEKTLKDGRDHQRRKADRALTLQQAEDERRRAESALEQQKKAAAEERRRELQRQRRAAQEEQKKLEQEERRKFLEKEQRKQDLVNKAKEGKTSKIPKGPVFSGVMDKLNVQMSALDAAEAERKRAQEAIRLEEEEMRKRKPESPESARKRIAEEARQRITLEEAGRVANLEKDKQENEAVKEGKTHANGATRQPTRQVQAQTRVDQVQDQASVTTPNDKNPRSPTSQPGMYFRPQESPLPQPAQIISPQGRYVQPPQAPPQSYRGQPAQQQQPWNQWHPQSQQEQRPMPQQLPFPPQQFGHQQQDHIPHHGQRFPYPHPAAPVPPFPGHQPPQPNAAHHHAPSGVDVKYKQMAQQAQDEATATTALKRNILCHWALQPPGMQILRPIDQLLCSIHSTFPPAFGVAPHSYFGGFQAIVRPELTNATGVLDKEKLKKAVRKVRFFLHPDKLPRDLNEDQQFTCKLLWDVTSDAWEDCKKSQEELDWIH